MISLSFSGCILDLLRGQVSLEQIDKLMLGCSWQNPDELNDLVTNKIETAIATKNGQGSLVITHLPA